MANTSPAWCMDGFFMGKTHNNDVTIKELDRLADQLRLMGFKILKRNSTVEGVAMDMFLPSYKIIITTSEIDFNQRNLLASKGYVVFYALDIKLISRGVILKLVQGIYDSSAA